MKKIIFVSGKSETPPFSCKVTVGNVSVLGEGKSKKEAKKAAALKMIQKLTAEQDEKMRKLGKSLVVPLPISFVWPKHLFFK